MVFVVSQASPPVGAHEALPVLPLEWNSPSSGTHLNTAEPWGPQHSALGLSCSQGAGPCCRHSLFSPQSRPTPTDSFRSAWPCPWRVGWSPMKRGQLSPMVIKVDELVFLVSSGSWVLAWRLESEFARITREERSCLLYCRLLSNVGAQLEVRKPNSPKALPRPSWKVFQGEGPKTLAPGGSWSA